MSIVLKFDIQHFSWLLRKRHETFFFALTRDTASKGQMWGPMYTSYIDNVQRVNKYASALSGSFIFLEHHRKPLLARKSGLNKLYNTI